MANPCAGLHASEQRNRFYVASQALTKLAHEFVSLGKNPESLMGWQFAEAHATALLAEIKDGAAAEQLKRVAEIEAEFNNRPLFAGARG